MEEHSIFLPLGLKIGEYKILKVLGHGAFGITYLAIDKNLNTKVAIKEYFPSELAVRGRYCKVRPKTLNDTEDYNWGLQQFLNEAKILATFDHPNIIKVHRFFKMHSTAYFVMQYSSGRSLLEALREIEENNETITEQEVKQLLFPLIDALDIIHSKNCLHRDIKPANIFIRDSDNQPILLDFGAARFSLGQHSKSISSILTPGYAPVEQYQTSMENQGPWTDIYALSATMYRLVTGKVPIDAFSRYASITEKKQDVMPSIYQTSNGVFSKPFLKALMYGLNIQKDKRPQSAMEWKASFTSMQKTEDEPASQLMTTKKQFEVYKHPISGYKAVKKGFSWGMFFSGFFFPIILMIVLGVKKMWIHISAIFLTLLTTSIIVPDNDEGIIITLLVTTTISLLYGFKGNKWYAKNLINKGYKLQDTIKAPNPEAATALVVGNKI